MTELSPMVGQFVEAGDDIERARILLKCPFAVLVRCHVLLEHHCKVAGFRLGGEYLSATMAALLSRRTDEGRVPDYINSVVSAHGERLGALIEAAADDQAEPPPSV